MNIISTLTVDYPRKRLREALPISPMMGKFGLRDMKRQR